MFTFGTVGGFATGKRGYLRVHVSYLLAHARDQVALGCGRFSFICVLKATVGRFLRTVHRVGLTNGD